MAISSNDIDSITGATVRGSGDDKIGTVGQVYVDPDGTPVWATVKTGLFGNSESFVPLNDATFDGKALQVTYTKDRVKDAPRVADDGELNEDETGKLYDYYGFGQGTGSGSTDTGTTGSDTTGQSEYDPNGYDGETNVQPREGSTGNYDRTTEGRDTSGPTTDDAMTRSEERLNVGTKKVETGRARLRKHIVTEQQTVTVPVSHDEVTVTREPITADNIGQASSGGDLTEEEHEVVLTADQVVTSKDTVPVERIKLGTDTVTEQQQVTEDVRKEQIDLVDPTDTTKR